jgi:hypothetical protein
MDGAKEFAARLHKRLIRHEDFINKLEDVLLWHRVPQAALLFLLVNGLFAVSWLADLSVYSVIFICIGVWQLWPYIGGVLLSIGHLVLPPQPLKIPAESRRQRFNIAEISAFVATMKFEFGRQMDNAWGAVREKRTLNVALVMFALMFLFYLFLSFSDFVVVLIMANGLLLLPLLIRMTQRPKVATT